MPGDLPLTLPRCRVRVRLEALPSHATEGNLPADLLTVNFVALDANSEPADAGTPCAVQLPLRHAHQLRSRALRTARARCLSARQGASAAPAYSSARRGGCVPGGSLGHVPLHPVSQFSRIADPYPT
jgi:hypothetical protein